MQPQLLESALIQYSTAAIKVLHFEILPHTPCFSLHWHDRMEFVRVKHGTLSVEIGTDVIQVSAGELVVLPPKTLHKGYTVDQKVGYDVLMFDVRSFYNETEICKTLLPAVFEGRAVFEHVLSDKKTIDCFDTVCQRGGEDSLEITALVYRLMWLLFELHLLEFRTQPKNAAVKDIAEYLEKHFRDEITLSTLCETFGYSQAYLCRKFKQTTGLTPMTYLKIYRLEQARKAIKNRDASIGSIALECGFDDPNYFTRCFKAHFGISPMQLKKTR